MSGKCCDVSSNMFPDPTSFSIKNRLMIFPTKSVARLLPVYATPNHFPLMSSSKTGGDRLFQVASSNFFASARGSRSSSTILPVSSTSEPDSSIKLKSASDSKSDSISLPLYMCMVLALSFFH